jgi:hypothetical protein
LIVDKCCFWFGAVSSSTGGAKLIDSSHPKSIGISCQDC